MSFRDFDQRISAKDIRSSIDRERAQQRAAVLHNRWRESEHVLSFMRTIRPAEQIPTKEIIDRWASRLIL